MKPLKVCIFTETYYPVVGGGETQAQLLAEGLIASGHSVIVITRRSEKTLKKQERLGAVTVYRIAPAGSGQLMKWGLLFSSFPLLIRLRKQYDLIFVSGFRIIGISAVLASSFLRKSCILKADSQGEMSGEFFTDGLLKLGFSPAWMPFRLFLGLRNKILRKADAFSAISSDIAVELSLSSIPPNKIHMIPNSVDTARFFSVTFEQKTRLRKKLGIPQNAIAVIYTGRLVSYKGLPTLLKAWRKIGEKHNDVHLYLVGTGGLDIHNCEAEIRDYVKTNHMESCVHFAGSVQNVPEYLQSSDIFAFPSENDAFPSSLIEAMACALPVITTSVGAIKTFISNEQNGMIVQPGDDHHLYHALDQIISDPVLANRLGKAGLDTVQTAYRSEVVTEKYLSLFHQTKKNSFGL